MTITGNKSNKTLKKRTRKKNTSSSIREHAAVDKGQFLLVQETVREMCKRADATSILHLAIAITERYKYFSTTDKSILRHAKKITKKYKIKICSSLYDVNDIEDLKKVAFENGIYI